MFCFCKFLLKAPPNTAIEISLLYDSSFISMHCKLDLCRVDGVPFGSFTLFLKL